MNQNGRFSQTKWVVTDCVVIKIPIMIVQKSNQTISQFNQLHHS